MRLFVGFFPNQTIKNKLNEVASIFRGRLSATFVDPQNFHLTLLFLGEVSPSLLPQIKLELGQIALNHHPFWLNLEKPFFLDQDGGGSLVVDLSTQGELFNLQNDLRLGLARFVSQKLVDQDYRPHLTLFRFKKNVGVSKANLQLLVEEGARQVSDLKIWLNGFDLTQSQLDRDGPHYFQLEHYHLSQQLSTVGVK